MYVIQLAQWRLRFYTITGSETSFGTDVEGGYSPTGSRYAGGSATLKVTCFSVCVADIVMIVLVSLMVWQRDLIEEINSHVSSLKLIVKLYTVVQHPEDFMM